MSWQDLQESFKLVEQHADRADFEGQKPAALVGAAESALGVRFPPSYREFLLKLGCGDIAGCEFYGIIGEEFENSSVPNGIWLTLKERSESGLPEHLLIVYADGTGTYYALDVREARADGECPVVAWRADAPGSGNVVAEDYGAFFLETLRQALA